MKHFLFHSICLILFLSIQLVICQAINPPSVFLLSHEWCRKCDKVKNIIQKLQNNITNNTKTEQFKAKQLKIHVYHHFHDFLQNSQSTKNNYGQQQHIYYQQDLIVQKSKVIYEKIQQKYKIPKQQVPFPTIWIQCRNYQGIYQNQLSYQQLQYWLGIYCYSEFPSCKQKNKNQSYKANTIKNFKKKDYQFKFNSQILKEQENMTELVNFQIKNSFVKLCIYDQNHQQVNMQQFSFRKAKQLNKYPLFFTRFDHNIRNYLLQLSQNENQQPNIIKKSHKHNINNKIQIFMIFNHPNHPKIKQFIDMYKFISDKIHGNTKYHINQGKLKMIYQSNKSHILQSQYHQSSIKNYGFRNLDKLGQSLIFIPICYNQNKNKGQCIFNYNYFIEQNKYTKVDKTQPSLINKYQIPFSFKQTKANHVKRLFQFTGISNPFQRSQSQTNNQNQNQKGQPTNINKRSVIKIMAVYFDKHKRTLKGFEYQDNEAVLGNNFLFWLENIVSWLENTQNQIQNQVDSEPIHHSNYTNNEQQRKKQTKKNNQHKSLINYCLSNQITHFLSKRNLTAIKENIKLQQYISKLNDQLANKLKKEKIGFQTVFIEQKQQTLQHNFENYKIWKASYYKICLKNKYSSFVSTIQQLKNVFQQSIDQLVKKVEINSQPINEDL